MPKFPRVLAPGATLGMLGGGQLGRMFAIAAKQCGYRICVYGDPADSPAGQVADESLASRFSDEEALLRFATQVDVVTYEQENIPVPTVRFLQQHVDVYPGPELLRASQHRLIEKTSMRTIGIPTADFLRIDSAESLRDGVISFGGEAILKTVTLGYDGKGQARIRPGVNVESIWSSFRVDEAILESIVDFAFELSIVASRFGDGTCAFYSPVLNHHVNHILDVSISPSSRISAAMAKQAEEMARAILEHFDVIGVLCVEFFATHDGRLLVNEIAPRPHNSGHLTIDACRSSQFEQQFRAVSGLPSGDVSLRSPAAMINLLGDHVMQATPEKWRSVFELPNVHVHMYGKSEARMGRKMGHLNVTALSDTEAEQIAREARRRLA
ncbi:MAG: 5-(carboxyamino)imidazole ribonucleotide synthase [Planctomycetota bacterium]